jgi:hypothetical protein
MLITWDWRCSETDEWYYLVNISSTVNTTGHIYAFTPQRKNLVHKMTDTELPTEN